MKPLNPIFGEPWGAYDAAPRVLVPVGQPCLWCTVLFIPGDQGHMSPYGKADGTVGVGHWHRECMLRSRRGSIAHTRGECSCAGGADLHPGTPAARRADAIATWNEWHRLTPGRPV